MPFASLDAHRRSAHVSPVRETPGWYWERRAYRLTRILESGGWSIHDLINQRAVRAAVHEQWRLSRCIDEDRQIEAYLSYLEYIEAVSRGVLPSPLRR
jgi:hypothetical protein